MVGERGAGTGKSIVEAAIACATSLPAKRKTLCPAKGSVALSALDRDAIARRIGLALAHESAVPAAAIPALALQEIDAGREVEPHHDVARAMKLRLLRGFELRLGIGNGRPGEPSERRAERERPSDSNPPHPALFFSIEAERRARLVLPAARGERRYRLPAAASRARFRAVSAPCRSAFECRHSEAGCQPGLIRPLRGAKSA